MPTPARIAPCAPRFQAPTPGPPAGGRPAEPGATIGGGELLILGVAIGANNFAVALALGALGQAPRRWRIAGVFGAFEFAVPLLGLLVGRGLADVAAGAGRWIGAALLAALGVWTLAVAARGRGRGESLGSRVTTWQGLAGLAAGLSLDNLVVGFALGLQRVSPLLVAGVIAAFSVTFTLAGLALGAGGRRRWLRPTELAAGVALLLVAAGVATGRLG